MKNISYHVAAGKINKDLLHNDELTENGYVVLRGQRLKSFLEVMPANFAKDTNVPSKIRQLGLFDFRAFLNEDT